MIWDGGIEDFTQTGHMTSVAEVNKPPLLLVEDAKPRNAPFAIKVFCL